MKIHLKIALFCMVYLTIVEQSVSQNMYGGIEIGSKGVKMTLLDVTNPKKGVYKVVDFWTENTAIAKNIAIDGCLGYSDIEKTVKVVHENHENMLRKHNVAFNKIFIVASSGVGMASNIDELITAVKQSTQKDMEVLSSKLESKLMYRGCIPPKAYKEAVILDIGAGNTKGGYAELFNDNLIFFPLNLNLGTITLTEQLNKTTNDFDNLDKFLDESLRSQNKLTLDVKNMFEQRPLTTNKKNIYMTGGAVWAFYTLYNEAEAQNFNPFTLSEVKEYGAILENNFYRFKKSSENNSEIARVLKTYSQKHLISANKILVTLLENLGDIDNKKIYFAKNGQLAWLMTYVVDSSRGVAVIY